MAKITYIDPTGTARTIDAEVGSTVMETAIKNDVPGIEAECGGARACATCHGYVGHAWSGQGAAPAPAPPGMSMGTRPGARRSAGRRPWKRTCSTSATT